MLWKAISVMFINVALMGGIQMFGVFALVPIYLHNGKQGRRMKWFFYGFYPVHLLILVFSENDGSIKENGGANESVAALLYDYTS